MLILACRQQRPTVGVVEKHVRSFRNIKLSELLEVATGLDWNAVRFISDSDTKVDYLHGLLNGMIDDSASMRTVKVKMSNSLSGMDKDVEQNRAYEIWHRNVNSQGRS
jgi:hypothetical protein